MPVCSGPDRAARKLTCVYDGDTGWEDGRKWRLLDIDAPEIGARDAGCRSELDIGKRSRDRLRALMTPGYRIVDSGKRDRSKRMLVRVQLVDGRDAGTVLMHERLAQAWPNQGNRWYGRRRASLLTCSVAYQIFCHAYPFLPTAPPCSNDNPHR